MESTWETRDLPVLEAAVRLLDEYAESALPDLGDLCEATGLDNDSVHRALAALQGEYLAYERGGGDGRFTHVKSVTAQARRIVGQWPTPEALVDRLVAALDKAAEQEPNDERRSKLRTVSAALGGAVRDVAVEVAATVVSRGVPL